MRDDATSPGDRPMRGFSLLEMLVVLVILGMAAALVAPPLARTVDRVREAGAHDDVRRQLQHLPMRARAEGRALTVDAGQPLPDFGRAWPEGWSVRALTALRIHASGVCERADVRVETPDSARTWRLRAPDCFAADADIDGTAADAP